MMLIVEMKVTIGATGSEAGDDQTAVDGDALRSYV